MDKKHGRTHYEQHLINKKSRQVWEQMALELKELSNFPYSDLRSITFIADRMADYFEENNKRFNRKKFYEIIGIDASD